MSRRIVVLVLLVELTTAAMAARAAARATIPEGPRLAVIRAGPPRGAPAPQELLNVSSTGKDSITVARASGGALFPSAGFVWSADGTRLGFGRVPILPPGDPIYTLPAGGGRVTAVRGTRGGFSPVFSPNGRVLAFARLRSHRRGPGRPPGYAISIWLVDARGGRSHQLTPWRDGRSVAPSSFAPDGTKLIGVRFESSDGPDVVSVDLDDGRLSPIVDDGAEPTYSPDGSTIAFIRWNEGLSKRGVLRPPAGDLYLSSADGSNVRRLTFDLALGESAPSWDPSGERLAYTQNPPRGAPPALLGGPGSAILEINADGTCEHRLLFAPGSSYLEAAWQPGPGRGAGPISC